MDISIKFGMGTNIQAVTTSWLAYHIAQITPSIVIGTLSLVPLPRLIALFEK